MPINTKQILADSFFDLCKTTAIRNIKPQDIADHCGVSRQTFYNHFRDKQEIVEYIWCRSVGNPITQFDDYAEWSIHASTKLDTNWWFYKKAIKDTEFLSWHENWMYNNMQEYVKEKYGESEITVDFKVALHTWLAGTCRSLPERKLQNPSISCKEISLMHHRNMPTLLLQYFPLSETTQKSGRSSSRTAII